MPSHGSCLCGAVQFDINGPLRAVINCHCTQCRKWTGHFVAATAAWKEDLQVRDQEGVLTWYRSSADARRGFCGRCGASLFWQKDGEATTTILAGTLDGNTGLKTEAEIYLDDKGDYYAGGEPGAAAYAQSGHQVKMVPRTADQDAE